MSATNRNGLARHARDYYVTPAWCTEVFLDELRLPSEGLVIDAGSGCGSITSVLADAYPELAFRGVEIDQTTLARAPVLDNVAYDCGDFLKYTPPYTPAAIVSNPPYSLALEFLQHAIAIGNKSTKIAFLLRLNFLGSKKRSGFLRKNTPDVFVLPKRPSFNAIGTDACEYAWFVWGPGVKGRLKILRDPDVCDVPSGVRLIDV